MSSLFTRAARRAALLAVVAGLPLAGLAATATASSASASTENNCQFRDGNTTPFSPWGDTNEYFTLAGGMFEMTPSGWTLTGGAGVVAGNEPWKVVANGTAKSLRVPAAGSVTTQWFCIKANEPTIRFFDKAPGVKGSMLTVTITATFMNSAGTSYNGGTATTTYRIDGSTPGWAVGPALQLPQKAGSKGSMVQVKIAPSAGSGDWQIDDFEVDPWRTK